MKRFTPLKPWVLGITVVLFSLPALGTDWPQWGSGSSRNMTTAEKGLPESFDPGKPGADNPGTGKPDPAAPIKPDAVGMKNVKWVARLGNATYGNPTVSGGKVFIGTNNEAPRNKARPGDFGVMMCLDEKTGDFLWQLTVPKLTAGNQADSGDEQ